MLAYLARTRQEFVRVGGLWKHARRHKEHHNRPGGGLVTGKISKFDVRLLSDGYNDGQRAFKSIRLNQFCPSSGLSLGNNF